MPVLTAVDPASVEGPLKTLFDQAERSLKHVPSMLRLMANSPPILEAYLHFNQAFHETKLSERLNILIAVTVAELSGCDYMLSRAMTLGRQRGVAEAALNEARLGEAAEASARAALRFAIAVVQERGRVHAATVDGLRQAGYDDQEIVEIIAAVGLNVFRNYFNLVAGTESDDLAGWPGDAVPAPGLSSCLTARFRRSSPPAPVKARDRIRVEAYPQA